MAKKGVGKAHYVREEPPEADPGLEASGRVGLPTQTTNRRSAVAEEGGPDEDGTSPGSHT